jgi:hypothetical protein
MQLSLHMPGLTSTGFASPEAANSHDKFGYCCGHWLFA